MAYGVLGIPYGDRPWAQRLFAAPIVMSLPEFHKTTTHGRLCTHWPIRHQQQPKAEGEGNAKSVVEVDAEGFVCWWWVALLPPDEMSPSWPRAHTATGRPRIAWVDARSFSCPSVGCSLVVFLVPQQQDRRRESSNQPPHTSLPLDRARRTDAGCTVQPDGSVPSPCTCTRR